MPKVFISHATQDREFVEREIIRLLEGHGVETWYSKEDIRTADWWERTLLHGLQACDWFLVVMSPRSAQSEWVKDEVHWAVEERPGRVIPVLLEDCNVQDFHIRITRIQHVDFSRDLPQAQRKLLEALRGARADAAGEAGPAHNPFTWRSGITDPAAFFNRVRELKMVRAFLHQRQNCQIVGPIRIGVTSLLRQIERLAGGWEEATAVAYLDLQAPQCQELSGWMQRVSRQFGWTTPPENLIEFAECVENELANGRRLVLCMDEVGHLLRRPAEFPRDFFTTLRACGHQGLSIITASRRPLSELGHPEAGETSLLDTDVSPFYNTFPLIRLGPFSKQDAADFVSLPRPGVPPFSPEEQTLIVKFSREHPLALQVACFHALEAKEHGEAPREALRKAKEDMKALLPTW
jgi:hypothetical protein